MIRKISRGLVSTVAGNGTVGTTDGTGSAARFRQPIGIAVDYNSQVLYVADSNNATLRLVTYGGVTSTIAGLAGATGTADGIGSAARFVFPTGLALHLAQNLLYVCDLSAHVVRKVDLATMTVSTLAGLANSAGSTDGVGAAARLLSPHTVTIDRLSNTLYVAAVRGASCVHPAAVVPLLNVDGAVFVVFTVWQSLDSADIGSDGRGDHPGGRFDGKRLHGWCGWRGELQSPCACCVAHPPLPPLWR